MFCIVDCNNFYASCERLFRPDLISTPIVVLSNNDGCCIARSNEAKALGIVMGEPFFKIKALCEKHQVMAFSSNYTLYGDISQRVMRTIEDAWPKVEIYSIDEAFLDLTTLPRHLQLSFCQTLQKKILKNMGIPTSIGIGKTKTLAKAANFLCKKVLSTPVFYLDHADDRLLQLIPVREIWGVGRQWSEKLSKQGIDTAYTLSQVNPHQYRKQFSVVMMRTIMELKGIPCNLLEEPASQQNIMSSKSFSQMQTEYDAIAQALSSYCARAVEKLRKHQLVAQQIGVFVHTNRHRLDLNQHYQNLSSYFINPTDDLRLITHTAKALLKRIYKPGYHYKKAGVYLQDLISKSVRQIDLFNPISENEIQKTEQLMSVHDAINKKYGRGAIRLASEGYSKPWSMRAELKSPAYTTCWSDVPRVRV